MIAAAGPWTPAAHDLFPLAARWRAWELYKIGALIARMHGSAGQAILDVWVAHVIPGALDRRFLDLSVDRIYVDRTWAGSKRSNSFRTPVEIRSRWQLQQGRFDGCKGRLLAVLSHGEALVDIAGDGSVESAISVQLAQITHLRYEPFAHSTKSKSER